MMAQFPSFSVIGPQFIAPKPLEIIVYKYLCRNLVITDINHKIILKVQPHDSHLHYQRVLLDANDKPIVMLRQKNLSMHSTWNVFEGESKSDSDMIFSVKKEYKVFSSKFHICVTLANKMGNNDSCLLSIKGNWSKGKFTIYKGDSSTEIAQMQKLKTSKYAADKFTITIHANMDYACVVALFAIVDAIEDPVKAEVGNSGGVGDVVSAFATLGTV